MKLVNHQFNGILNLNNFIDEKIDLDKSILVQLFCGVLDKKSIKPILKFLKEKIPQASIIGASTAGEINAGILSSNTILLSFCEFENVDVKTFFFDKANHESGKDIAKNILTNDSKVAIIYCETFNNDLESFLNGFTSVNSDIILAGGNAGDNYRFESTFIIENDTIYDNGFVIALLDSTTLNVSTEYSLNWTPIGKEMIITKVDGNIVYEIDNMPVKELYSYYLGEETVANIPASAIEFPLIKVENDISIARAMVSQNNDGGIVYAGHFKKGDKVRFAIGNIAEILNSADKLTNDLASFGAEAIFIFSCSVRKIFLENQLNYEFSSFQSLAPTSGFFTYGEIYHQNLSAKLLNITTTLLILSESCSTDDKRQKNRLDRDKYSMLKSLTHLVNTTQNDLDEKINFLNQYQMLLDESSIVSKTDIDGYITYVNNAFCEISGYTKDELLGQRHSILRHPDMDANIYEDLWSTILKGKTWHGNIKNLAKDGSAYYVMSTILPIYDKNGNILEFIAARTDVSELIKKDEIIFEKSIDKLTGLYNRNTLLEKLSVREEGFLLVLLNIVGFSEVNNYFGYEVGDKLLIAFSKLIKELISNVEYYRISGDEFAIFLKSDESIEYLSSLIYNVVELIEKNEFIIDDYNIGVSISAGMAYGNTKDIYREAHLALKESKEKKINFLFYNLSSNLKKKTNDNILIIEKIKKAISNNKIIPYFQGILDNKTKQISKYEVLMRLIDEDGSILTPYWFLDQAKKSKLYKKLTKIIMKKSFEFFSNNDFEFNINFTIEDILSLEIRRELFRLLEKYNCGERLTLEIVESEGIENYEEVLLFISSIRQFGCKVAIDDFGTGYSNFDYLTKIEVDFIKIDGSLIKNIDEDDIKFITVEAIIKFAKKLGIKTVAEYVERESVQDMINSLEIDYSQGFLFSTPSSDL